jgi:hypothetical protein
VRTNGKRLAISHGVIQLTFRRVTQAGQRAGHLPSNRDGKPQNCALRRAVNATFLNVFLKERRKVEEEEATITKLKKQIEALTMRLQNVRAQLNRASLQTVANSE